MEQATEKTKLLVDIFRPDNHCSHRQWIQQQLRIVMGQIHNFPQAMFELHTLFSILGSLEQSNAPRMAAMPEEEIWMKLDT